MARRDRSQGFGFVYGDLKEILAHRKEIIKAELAAQPAPVETQKINFNKDQAPQSDGMELVRQRANAIQQIRENLDRLQSLHHKLHAMLEELNRVTDREKRRKT